MQSGDPKTERALLDSALALDPLALIPRRAYITSLETRWGGSLDQMSLFLESSRKAGLSAEQLAELQKFIDSERVWLATRGSPAAQLADSY